MTAISGVRPGPERTRALLEQIMGGERGAQLRAKLANANPSATPELIDEAFQVACIRANTACHGQTEGEVYVWLRTTAHREIGHLRASTDPEVPVDTWGSGFDPPDPRSPAPVDVLIDREDEAEIRRVTRSILDRLSERQREIVALHSHGRSRHQIADHLNLSPRVVKRSIEHILAAGREELVRLAGHGCEAGEDLVARTAFGLAGAREMREAQLHLATCPSCGALYERLDCWREKVAVLLPVPAVAGAQTPVVEKAIHTGADIVGQADGPAGETHRGLRSSLADVINQAREHTAGLYTRAVDPTPLAGARPGAVAAAVAGCLAVGGGATYCVEKGVGPVGGFAGIVPAQQDKPKPKPKPRKARAAQAPAPPVVTPTVTAPPPVVQQPAPQPAAPTTTVAEPPPAPEDEYEPTSAGATSSAPAQAASSPPATPAPAPAGGPGEFDGP